MSHNHYYKFLTTASHMQDVLYFVNEQETVWKHKHSFASRLKYVYKYANTTHVNVPAGHLAG
jgi:hypothetical protein